MLAGDNSPTWSPPLSSPAVREPTSTPAEHCWLVTSRGALLHSKPSQTASTLIRCPPHKGAACGGPVLCRRCCGASRGRTSEQSDWLGVGWRYHLQG